MLKEHEYGFLMRKKQIKFLDINSFLLSHHRTPSFQVLMTFCAKIQTTVSYKHCSWGNVDRYENVKVHFVITTHNLMENRNTSLENENF